LQTYNAAKCDCGRGYAPDPAGSFQRSPDPLADFKGVASRRGKGEKEGKRKGTTGLRREEKGRGRVTLMLS